MALVVDALTSQVISEVKKHPNGGKSAFIALGKAIEDYLVLNTTLVQATLTKSGDVFDCSPSDFADFVTKLQIFLEKIIWTNTVSGVSMTIAQMGLGTLKLKQIGGLEDEKNVDKAMKSAFSSIAKGVFTWWQPIGV